MSVTSTDCVPSNVERASELTVGTDCSGIDSPIFALRELGIPHKHLFSSEVDENALKVIRSNCQPKMIYRDILERPVEKVPYVDLYITGPPCQSYSNMNIHKKKSDPRQEVFETCIAYIDEHRPKCFIIENVRAILSAEKGKVWQRISQDLDAMRDTYHWEHAILDACDYGCAQSRPRVFIVGLHRSLATYIPWPAKIPLDHTCLDYLDEEVREGRKLPQTSCYLKMCDVWGIPRDTRCIVEFNGASRTCSPYKNPKQLTDKQKAAIARTEIASCVVAHDPSPAALHLGRYLNPNEILKLQGHDPDKIRVPPTMSSLQFSSLVGNAMNGAVLKALLRELVPLLAKKEACANISS